MTAETSQTLDRGLRLLTLLTEHPRGLTITEIATAMSLNRTVVYRLVSTLEQHGLSRRDAQGRVQLGLGVLRFARGVHPVLRGLAAPTLRGLAEDVGATAHLTVADGPDALAIAVVEPSWTDYHVGYRVGARHALDRGAAGKAILLGRAIAAGDQPGPAFVTTQGELQSGAIGVAAPVRGLVGVEASVGVVSLGGLEPEQTGPKVIAAARQIAESLT
ncbi:MAG: helix-turn-helix domain-containing protein [Propionibacteriales bacterium]|nr:helix-turn-helix domain-containing protein [Propionibacteriales bacterium]